MPWTTDGQYIDDGTSSDNSGNDAYTGYGANVNENVFDPSYGGQYGAGTTENVFDPSYGSGSAGGGESVFDPTFGGQYTPVSNPAQTGGGLLNYLKSMDLTSAGGLAGAALGATGAFTNKPKKAYEGKIPQMQAIRNMVTAPPTANYRPGQGGVNWNANTYYVPKGSVAAGEGANLAAAAAAANAANAAKVNPAAAKKNNTLTNLAKTAGLAALAKQVLGGPGNKTTDGIKTLLDKITGGTTGNTTGGKTTTTGGTTTTTGGKTTNTAGNTGLAGVAGAVTKGATSGGSGGTSGGSGGSGGTRGSTGGAGGVNTENAEQPVYATQEEADAANEAAGQNELDMAAAADPYDENGDLKEGYELDEEGNPVLVGDTDTSTIYNPDGSTGDLSDLGDDTTFSWDEDMGSGYDFGGSDDTTYDWSGDMSNTDYGDMDYSGFDFGSNDFDLGDYDLGDFDLARGGQINMAKGRYLQGTTDGMADKIPARIGQKQPAALSHGEFVVPADVVSHLGNGNSDAGAKKLYQMMDKIRVARTGTKQQGKQINPDKFMPGGLAKAYAAGGSVKKFVDGGSTGATGLGAAVNAGITGSETGPNSWAGDYMSDLLGKTQALTESPYQQYMGPLSAGASGLQNQVFTGLQNTNFPGNLGQSFSSTGAYQAPQMNANAYQTQPIGTGGNTPSPSTPQAPAQPTGIASQYMNPYLQGVLDPQLAELRRQNDITNMNSNAKMAQAGAFGGSRQAILNAENNRNLMQEMNKTVGAGYANAFDKAQQQFNTEQTQGRSLADLMAQQGATQRGIEAEGMAADKASFEAARENPYKMLQFQQSMLNGLPVSATNYTIAQPTKAQEIMAGAAGGAKAVGANNKTVADLLQQLGL